MLMHTRERDNNSDTAGKGLTYQKKTTTTDEQFISKTLLCSILSVVEKGSFSFLRRAVFIFTTDKPSWAKPSFTRYIF